MRRRSSVRIRTRKVIGRITYEPEKHKQKFIKSLRRDLASRPPDKPKKSPTPARVDKKQVCGQEGVGKKQLGIG